MLGCVLVNLGFLFRHRLLLRACFSFHFPPHGCHGLFGNLRNGVQSDAVLVRSGVPASSRT